MAEQVNTVAEDVSVSPEGTSVLLSPGMHSRARRRGASTDAPLAQTVVDGDRAPAPRADRAGGVTVTGVALAGSRRFRSAAVHYPPFGWQAHDALAGRESK